jgi:hypothetical protein
VDGAIGFEGYRRSADCAAGAFVHAGQIDPQRSAGEGLGVERLAYRSWRRKVRFAEPAREILVVYLTYNISLQLSPETDFGEAMFSPKIGRRASQW